MRPPSGPIISSSACPGPVYTAVSASRAVTCKSAPGSAPFVIPLISCIGIAMAILASRRVSAVYANIANAFSAVLTGVDAAFARTKSKTSRRLILRRTKSLRRRLALQVLKRAVRRLHPRPRPHLIPVQWSFCRPTPRHRAPQLWKTTTLQSDLFRATHLMPGNA
jgi:hypothetical protein